MSWLKSDGNQYIDIEDIAGLVILYILMSFDVNLIS